MLANIKEYHRPSTLSEARQILLSTLDKYLVIAGGTSLVFVRRASIKGIVDISELNLRNIKQEASQLQIGALATLNQLAKSSLCQKLFNGVLSTAANSVATKPLRNLITVGGNVALLFSWSIMPVALLALKARIIVKGQRKRVISATSFFAHQPARELKPGDLITGITIPVKPGWFSFTKFSRAATDFGLVSLAMALFGQDSRIYEPRLVVGSVASLPVRLTQVEELIKHNKMSNKLIKEAQQLACAEVRPAKDFRTTIDYKKSVVGVLVKRALHAYMKHIGLAR